MSDALATTLLIVWALGWLGIVIFLRVRDIKAHRKNAALEDPSSYVPNDVWYGIWLGWVWPVYAACSPLLLAIFLCGFAIEKFCQKVADL